MAHEGHELKELFDAVVQAHRHDVQPFRYRFSKAGEPCVRSLVYDAMEADEGVEAEQETSLKGILIGAIGKALHETLQRGCVLLGDTVEEQCTFDTGAVVVTGACDWKRKDAVSDFKICGENKWLKIQKAPLPKNVHQVNGYAIEKDKPFWELIYIDAMTIFAKGVEVPRVKIYRGATDLQLARDLCGVWEEVDTHRKLKTLPERVFDAAPDKWPCMFCNHKARCLG